MNDNGRVPDLAAVMARHLRCHGCARRYRTLDISSVESAPRFGVYQLRCSACNTRRLVIAVWNRNRLRTFSTELDQEEWRHYRKGTPVDVDDVLRFHGMLAEYDGDLSDVLEDPILGHHE